MIDVCSALEGVGTGLGDGVYATADEVGLADIVRGNNNLKFLNCVDGDRVATAGEVVGKAEVVVEVCTVNGEVGSTAVGTCEAHSVTAVRRQTGYVRDVTVNGREAQNLFIGDVGNSSGALLSGEL